MDNKKLVIFDFDGVIVNTFPFAYEIMHGEFGLSEDEYRKKFEGNFYKHTEGVPEQKPSPTFDFFAEYTPRLMDSTPEEGILETIKTISEHYTLAIVSSTLTKSIHDYLEKMEIRNCFQEILGSDVEKNKEKKIRTLLETHNKQPEEVVFVTDTVGDVQEAEKCGVKSVTVTWGYHPRETLEKANPFRIVEAVSELENAIDSCFAQ